MSLPDYQRITDELVRDAAGKLTADERNRALAMAVARYGRDRPRTKVQDVTGDGTRALALPAAWEADFSAIRAIEYPTGNIPPTLLEDWALYQGTSSTVIHLASAVASGAAARVTFTIAPVLTMSADTIPAADREAVCAWAAALLCDQLAALYSNQQDSTLGADAVDHRSKATEYAARARNLRQRYHDELGIDPKRSAPAGVVVDLDLPSSAGGARLTHEERYR